MILNRFGQQAIESLLILLKFPIESSNTCTLVLIKHVFNVIKGEDLTSGKFQKQQVLVFQFYRGPLSAITLKRYKKFYIKRYTLTPVPKRSGFQDRQYQRRLNRRRQPLVPQLRPCKPNIRVIARMVQQISPFSKSVKSEQNHGNDGTLL